MAEFAWLYINGKHGYPKDIEKGLKYLRKSMGQNYIQSHYEMALYLEKNGDKKGAAELYKVIIDFKSIVNEEDELNAVYVSFAENSYRKLIKAGDVSQPIKHSLDGFRGIKWREPPIKLGKNRKLVSRDDKLDIVICSRPEDKMSLGNAGLEKILYTFYKNKLLSVEIHGEKRSFDEMRKIAVERFGEPHFEERIYPKELYWADDQVYIKLKDQDVLLDLPPLLTIRSISYWEEYLKDQDAAKTDF